MQAYIQLNDNEKINLDEKRIGLALSGGGYRASFFHVGVLASLAEKDLLRYVAVLSTVSGGSIIGTLYFLKLREKLVTQQPLSHQDYINIVKDLENDLMIGVSKNLRSKVFLHPWYEISAVFRRREKILAQLYERYFYKSTLTMDELNIGNSIPKLIINATNLGNGGHWYFSQFDMGQYADSKIVNSEGHLPYTNERIYLKDAVAASSAVPGLFNYVKLKTNSRSYKLVDGGAFDNLGLFPLQKENCDVIILSDGSKQLIEEQFIPRKRLSVLKRSYDSSLELNKKLMLEACPEYFRIHLKEIHNQIDPQVSDALSKLRTDLNNFSPQERKSLGYFAYLLTNDIENYVQIENQLLDDFEFKDSNNTALMQKPEGNFLWNLERGSKLNRAGSIPFISALNEMKFFFITFLSFFLFLFYVSLLESMGVISSNNPVVLSYISVMLSLIGLASLYMMLNSTLGDYIHYVDWLIAKVVHILLAAIYLIVIIVTAIIVVLMIVTSVKSGLFGI